MFEPRPGNVIDYKSTVDAPASVTEISVDEETPFQYIPASTWTIATPRPVESTLAKIFHDHVLERPDAPAVVAHDGSYTYRELDDQSTTLAHELHRRHSVGPESVVALLFEKSKLITVALHAVVKAGGAILLWDPSLPVARLRDIFLESGAQLIVTSTELASKAQDIGPHIYALDKSPLEHSSELGIAGPQPSNALYSVFTSGSTGKPKGFLMEHRALLTCALSCGQRLGLTTESRTLQFSSNSFDLANFEHLIPFVFGACMCIPSEEERKGDLNGALQKYRVNVAFMTPSVSRLLEPRTLPLLKTVMLAGEPVTVEDIRRLTPYVSLHDGYSPAEAGCIGIMNSSKNEACPANVGYSLGVLPWVVDASDHDQLLPIGEVGELIIQGHTVGRGYFGPPERSAGSFIPPPPWVKKFNRETYGSLYKTGDLVRYDPMDGSLLFVGRKDSQVKLHGQRLELQEVEHQLRHFFPIPQVVVVDLVETETRGAHLIAFVGRSQDNTQISGDSPPSQDLFLVPDESFLADVGQALEGLRQSLPSYMVPADILLMSHVLMMPSGKTDRRSMKLAAAALTATDRRKYSSCLGTETSCPSTTLENSLCKEWAATLGMPVDQIGIDDNFFSLGGSSLEALHLAARARKLGFANLSSAFIFKHPTIRSMAHMLDEDIASKPATNSQLVAPVEMEPTLLNQLLLGGQLNLDDLESGVLLPTTNFQQKSTKLKCMHILVDVSGVDHHRLQEAWTAVQCKHMSLRSVYVAHDSAVYQGFFRQPDTTIPIEHCQSQTVDEFATSYCDQDAEPPSSGHRWWKLTRINSSDGKSSLLVIRTTHAQFDAMTLTATFKDFMAAYHGLKLSQPRSSIVDYMSWRLRHSSSPETTDFWKHYLDGSRMAQPLLTDESTANVSQDSIGMVMAMQQIHPMPSPPPGITVASVFRAAWAFVLSRYMGENDLVFGEFVEGRTSPVIDDAENITGCTSAETPIRVIVPSHPGATVHELLTHSQEQYIVRIPYETCELPDLAPYCDAMQTTRFSHYLVVENTSAIPAIVLDGRTCEHRWAFHGRLEDVQVQLVPGPGTLHVAIFGPEIRLAQTVADLLVGRLAETMRQFNEHPAALLAEIRGGSE